MNKERYELGLKMLEQLHGGRAGEMMVKELGEVYPELMDMTIEWAFGEVVSRKGIDLKTRELVTIAACIAKGNVEPQLKAHYAAALKVGATKDEILEVILQMVFYAGMAQATNAVRLAKQVFAGE